MRMTIEEHIAQLKKLKSFHNGSYGASVKVAIDSMRKCQRVAKAIDKVEEYICDVETDTVKAQGMAQALDIFEQALGEVLENGNGEEDIEILEDKDIILEIDRETLLQEYIPKADYETRLKAILVELQLQMEEYEPKWVENDEQAVASCRTWEDLDGIIQNKINTLKEQDDGNID